MPTYEYECDQCEERFEKFQNMKDDPVKTCPKCGGAVRRLIGPGAAIIFKGSGFHATDYGRGVPDAAAIRPAAGEILRAIVLPATSNRC